MKAMIRNFRGCERADLDLSAIALVAGDNAAGKSSSLQAVACALAGRPLLIPELGKKGLPLLVRSGAQSAVVKVSSEEGSVTIDYPKGEAASMGTPPHASAFAVGLEHVLDLDDKARAKTLAAYLKTDPTRDDLAIPLRDAGFPDVSIGEVWELATSRGWDGAHVKAKEDGARLKGRWEQVTGERYGSAKAAEWRPADWSEELRDASDADLARAVTEAKAALDTAIANSAVAQSDLDKLEAEAAELDDRTNQLDQAKINLEKAEGAERDAKKALDMLPGIPDGKTDCTCPHCGNAIDVRPGAAAGHWRVSKVEILSADELKKRRLAIASADGAWVRLKAAAADARRIKGECETAVTTAREAGNRFAAQSGKSNDTNAVPIARANLAKSEALQSAAKKKREADGLAKQVAAMAIVVDALSENGVRRAKLLKIVGTFNEQFLATLAEAASWRRVELTSDLEATYDGRPYRLLSASEQYRVRVVYQLALARLDNSELVIVDGADILARDGRNGLFALLRSFGRPAIVGMTFSKHSDVPDLAGAGFGTSYWMKGGLAEPMVAANREAAQ